MQCRKYCRITDLRAKHASEGVVWHMYSYVSGIRASKKIHIFTYKFDGTRDFSTMHLETLRLFSTSVGSLVNGRFFRFSFPGSMELAGCILARPKKYEI